MGYYKAIKRYEPLITLTESSGNYAGEESQSQGNVGYSNKYM
jgi:hypothetical protein